MFRALTLLVIVLVITRSDSQLPPSFKVCSRNAPNLANCLKEAIEHIRPYLRTGDFGNGWKFDGIEPLRIDDILINKGRNVFISAKNILARRSSYFTIDKIKVNMDNFNIDVIADFKNIEATGNYKANIKLAAFRLEGEGTFIAEIADIKLYVKLTMQRYMKNGEEYIRIANATPKILKLGKIKVNLQDPSKDKVINEITNAIVNENTALFIDDFAPKITTSISRHLTQAGNQLIERAPLKYVFPY